ncbi:hypothetical protein DFJ74DRAFT_295828 [Hyaloraphidium curvatum]|nr:hypothetical protein DFJ74DRAFT_295828 [Hyaloraphidium curvatum]
MIAIAYSISSLHPSRWHGLPPGLGGLRMHCECVHGRCSECRWSTWVLPPCAGGRCDSARAARGECRACEARGWAVGGTEGERGAMVVSGERGEGMSKEGMRRGAEGGRARCGAGAGSECRGAKGGKNSEVARESLPAEASSSGGRAVAVGVGGSTTGRSARRASARCGGMEEYMVRCRGVRAGGRAEGAAVGAGGCAGCASRGQVSRPISLEGGRVSKGLIRPSSHDNSQALHLRRLVPVLGAERRRLPRRGWHRHPGYDLPANAKLADHEPLSAGVVAARLAPRRIGIRVPVAEGTLSPARRAPRRRGRCPCTPGTGRAGSAPGRTCTGSPSASRCPLPRRGAAARAARGRGPPGRTTTAAEGRCAPRGGRPSSWRRSAWGRRSGWAARGGRRRERRPAGGRAPAAATRPAAAATASTAAAAGARRAAGRAAAARGAAPPSPSGCRARRRRRRPGASGAPAPGPATASTGCRSRCPASAGPARPAAAVPRRRRRRPPRARPARPPRLEALPSSVGLGTEGLGVPHCGVETFETVSWEGMPLGEIL